MVILTINLTITVSSGWSVSGSVDRAVQMVALPALASLPPSSARSGASSAHLAAELRARKSR
ncbi:hypothetical protein WCN79_14350 [Xanthomonas axonopodis pv. vasculorum]|uniref:hypothetical protein n=1 Tax=Xanthomonas axonopodis TaxID=53413 RepID=UPI000A60E0CD|nr:hypothetical protein [Xanthomonas axonopodis]